MVLVGIVIVVLAVAYMAIIGWSSPVSDFSPGGGFNSNTGGSNSGNGPSGNSPSGNSSAPTSYPYVAYATFTVDYLIPVYNGGFVVDSSGTFQAANRLMIEIIGIHPSVQPYTDMSTGQVYEHHLLQLSQGTGGEGGPISAFITYYATVTLTGSGGYRSSWDLASRVYSTLTLSIEEMSFETGRSWFPADGEFQASVSFYQYMNGVPVLLITALSDFSVSY